MASASVVIGAWPALAIAPVKVSLQPFIVQASSEAVAHAAVDAIVTANGGVGQVVLGLPLVNGVLANLTTVEVAQLPATFDVAVSPDAKVLTSMLPAKGKPQPPPTNQQLVPGHQASSSG